LKNTEDAFKWMVEIIGKHKIPFQITGGLAARIYGSSRPLADIDIEIPKNKFKYILEEVKDYIKFGPKIFKDDNWDLYLMTLDYAGQEIDICDSNSKIKDYMTEKWIENRVDFSRVVIQDIFGLRTPVVPIEDLIRYKKILKREVDVEDIKNLSK